ncbi:hypothetical protein B9Q04_11425 [Candidatus Marsarchaeota G2 archaeon BE_D]|uniref:Uncharacterized protein n=2 Tax=Candidatus Marsarchaeota group 2 TaxID=2203771 RepID=A0A2R6C935_9ARCH|nr:MAG: hypothetical protein B9Q08_04480 [Candidatus Marsarchaeota G2 archaeon ECH_B_SAG-M15]PSO07340.1 MAG: hypothetical protein B9Q04_11425 [Candidatus Marsarchaeota G2 archaeon BE_D]
MVPRFYANTSLLVLLLVGLTILFVFSLMVVSFGLSPACTPTPPDPAVCGQPGGGLQPNYYVWWVF